MAATAATANRPGRRKRWLRRVAALIALACAAGLVYLTRPATLARLILPIASRAIGGEVTATEVALGGLNSIVLSDLRVRAPEWEGPAGEIMHADSLEIRFSLLSLLVGDFRLRSVHANRLELRLAESAERPGDFSVLSLKPEETPDDQKARNARQRPDEIAINELRVENGVLGRAGYRKLGELCFQGHLTPDAEVPTGFVFSLVGRPDSKGSLSIGSIAGRFDPDSRSVSVNCDDLKVDGRELPVAPIAVRAWTSRLGIEGLIARASFAYAPGVEPSALINLQGAAMDLPVDALSGGALEGTWGGFAGGKSVDLVATPRMTLHTGTLRLERNELRFEDVEGELGANDESRRVIALPFKGKFSVKVPTESLPGFEWDQRESWLEAAARIAPFSIDLEIPSFTSPEPKDGAPDTLQLPRAATKILSDFNITSWAIHVSTSISRGAPTADGKPGALHSSGRLDLERGSGAFEEFPYRLEDVVATITFEDDNLAVRKLTGKGADGAEVEIDGRLDGLSQGALIDLRIRCLDAPIDDRLFNAFEEAPREALSLLFDERAARQLGEAGLLPDATHLVEQRKELSRLGDDDAVKSRRERLQRSNDAGPFALRGRCGFDMRVFSEPGWGKPVEVTGKVDVRDAGLVFGRFPYPLRLKSGSFRVLDEAIELAPEGISAITPAGGVFKVTGKVEIPRLPDKSRGMRPRFHISDVDDAINPSLLAAIPHSGDDMPAGWPGASLAPAGELLRSLGLGGTIALDGTITSDDKGQETFDIRIDFSDGVAAPDADGRAQLAEDGLPWPPEFTLEDCRATLLLTPEKVTITDCTGRNGGGSISARAEAELEGPRRSIDIELKQLPIGRAFEGYLASEPGEAAARFARFGPSGAIDGSVHREVTEHGGTTSGRLTPSFVEITLDGSRMRADHVAGFIGVDSDGLQAESLEFRLGEGSQDDGFLRLSGRLSGGAAGGAAPLDAQLSGTRVESPLVRELLLMRSKGTLDLLRSRNAKGRFNAHYTGGERERFTITPRTLSVGQSDASVEMSFAESDAIAGDGDRIAFDVHGTLTGAHSGTVAVKGEYESGADNRLTASFAMHTGPLTPALRQQLPPPLDFAATNQNLVTTRSFDLDLTDIALRWPATGSAASPDIYQLRGTARLSGAAFDAGTHFSEVDGELPLRFRYEPRGANPMDFSATLTASGGRVFDREIGLTRATLATGAGGQTMRIQAAGDVAFGRFDLDTALDFERHRYDARVRIADSDYEVLRQGLPPVAATPRSASRISGLARLTGSTTESVDSRTGMGRVSIRNATLASMPVAMRVLQLTQLMLPMSSTISATNAEFNIKGNTAEVTRCTLAAGTIELEGTGTVDIPTFAIGMRLFAKGTVPIVSDVIGGVTSKIFAIDLGGTLSDPKATLAPLPGMSDMPTPPQSPAEPAPAEANPADAAKTADPAKATGVSTAKPATEPKKPQQ